MRLLIGCLLLILATVPAFAADISGKWTGKTEIKMPDGSVETVPIWLDLRQEGTTITGGAASEPDSYEPIENGKLEGDKLSFQVTNRDGRVIKVKATVAAKDRIEGTVDFTAPDGTPLAAIFVVTREAK